MYTTASFAIQNSQLDTRNLSLSSQGKRSQGKGLGAGVAERATGGHGRRAGREDVVDHQPVAVGTSGIGFKGLVHIFPPLLAGKIRLRSGWNGTCQQVGAEGTVEGRGNAFSEHSALVVAPFQPAGVVKGNGDDAVGRGRLFRVRRPEEATQFDPVAGPIPVLEGVLKSLQGTAAVKDPKRCLVCKHASPARQAVQAGGYGHSGGPLQGVQASGTQGQLRRFRPCSAAETSRRIHHLE